MSEFDELIQIYQTDPARLEQIFRENPDLARRWVEWADTLTAGDEVTVEGFKIAYKKFYGRELPYVDIPVAEEFVWAYKNKKGVVYESWRGKGKSTFFAAWCPYVMGVRPVGSTALIRINDSKAKEMGKLISELIMGNPGWQEIFPHVVPDERAGWSVDAGFQVMDTRVTGLPGSKDFEENYAKWRMMCFADHLSEKSLICSGIESGSNIGLHPTNGEWFDDLHDELNTRSPAELQKVVDIVKGNMIPTWFSAGGSPTLGVFCTPWSTNPPDVYQVMLATGMFKHIKMPIFVADDEGELVPDHFVNDDGQMVMVVNDWVGKRVKLAWPEMFPMRKVLEMMVAFKTKFGQACLCDVSQSSPKNMKYQEFPASDIKWDKWELTNGVDPVGTVEGVSQGSGLSHFASAWLLTTPWDTLIVGDGIVEKCDATTGEGYVLQTQRTYNATYRAASIELNGAGALFVRLLTQNKGVKYHGHVVSEIGVGSKKDRQYKFLQPLFATGVVKVSDAKTDFLDAVREYLENFPNFPKDSRLWDVGDALAIGILDLPRIWTRVVVADAVDEMMIGQKQRRPDPWDALLQDRR